MASLKKQVVVGVIWRMLEQFGSQLITFAVSVVLSRILEPAEFGTVALLAIFVTLSGCLVQSGFGNALIQKKGADDLDFNSVFYFSLSLSAVIYCVLWFCAPVIASFYNKPILVMVLRITAVKLIFDAVSGVQNAILNRKMLFNRSFWITLAGSITAGAIGIYMAYHGYGLWSLVWSSVIGSFVGMVVRWFLIGWRPGLQFSWGRLSGLFGFGSKMLFSGLLETFFTQIYGLLIGKWYSTTELAFFNRGEHLPLLSMNCIQGSIGSVIFPALSKLQDQKDKLRSSMRQITRLSSFIVFPLMFGLAAVSEPLIRFLFTDKWLPAVPFMRLACVSYAFWPLHVANLQVIQALGRGDIYLKLEIIKKTLQILTLVCSFKYGVFAIAFTKMILSPVALYINSYPNKRLISCSQNEQFHDIFSSLILSVVMSAFVFTFSFFIENLTLLLAMQVIFGVAIYVCGAFIFQVTGLHEALAIIKHGFKMILKNR